MDTRTKLDVSTPSGSVGRVLEFFRANLKGQDSVIEDIADALEVHEAGFQESDKPIYTALFAGPSGVGKTLLAELLALQWFGSRHALIKIPCEEYSAEHSVAALIGSPAGYVGHWDPNNARSPGTPPILSQENLDKFANASTYETRALEKEIALTQKKISDMDEHVHLLLDLKHFPDPQKKQTMTPADIDNGIKTALAYRKHCNAKLIELNARRAGIVLPKPKSIVLFDEIEKAGRSLHNIILNMLDKGQLVMANGIPTDLTNSVILATSNANSRAIAELLTDKHHIGFVQQEKRPEKDLDRDIYRRSMKALQEKFPPEFLARWDRLSIFRPLSRNTIEDIFDVELDKFVMDFLDQYEISLKFGADFKKFIVDEATDKPQNGARLLKGKITKHLKRQVARLLNKGDIGLGDTVCLAVENVNGRKEIVFTKGDPKS